MVHQARISEDDLMESMSLVAQAGPEQLFGLHAERDLLRRARELTAPSILTEGEVSSEGETDATDKEPVDAEANEEGSSNTANTTLIKGSEPECRASVLNRPPHPANRNSRRATLPEGRSRRDSTGKTCAGDRPGCIGD